MASKLRAKSGPKISFFAFQDIITSVTGILILTTLILSLYIDEAPPVSQEQEREQQQLSAAINDLARLNLENQLRQQSMRILASPPAPEQLQSQIRELENHVAAFSNRLASANEANKAQLITASNKAEMLISDLKQHATRAERELEVLRQSNAVIITEIKAIQTDLEKKRLFLGRGDNPLFVIPDSNPDGKQAVLMTLSATNFTCERFNQPESKESVSGTLNLNRFTQALRKWHPQRDYLVFYVRPSGIALFHECLEAAREAGFQTGYDAADENQNLVFSSPDLP